MKQCFDYLIKLDAWSLNLDVQSSLQIEILEMNKNYVYMIEIIVLILYFCIPIHGFFTILHKFTFQKY